MSLYEKNIQALTKINSQLATKLFSLQTNTKFEVFVDKKDSININIANNKTLSILYDGIPIKQTQEKLKIFSDKYQRYLFLYFYGLGNGVFFKALLQNKSIVRIVVVEPEIELIYIAFNFNDFTKEIEEGRLEIYLSQDIDSTKAIEIFSHPESKLFAKVYQFHSLLPFYEANYAEDIIKINSLFIQAIEHVVIGIGNSSIDALTGIKHHIAHINKMLETPTLLELIKSCKNSEVAVIVSTGPSLKKQLSLLKQIQPYVTILCIDASFPILEKANIKPDIVFSIEREAPTAKFYTLTSKKFQEDVIFAITSIAHPALFKEIKAGKLQISMRPFGYTRYFDKPDYGYLGIGMSAANMAYELAYHANFKTCILIGQDLAFAKDGASHSEGHVFGIGNVPREQCLEVLSYGGKEQIQTTMIWKLFKNFFETDIAFANKKGMKTINATEGGARIEGSIETSFKKSIDKYVNLTHKKEKILLHKRTKVDITKDKNDIKKKIKKMLAYARKIQKETEKTFVHVATECEIINKIDEEQRYKLVDFKKLADIMMEIDNIKKYFNEQIFADIFIDATQALIIHQEIDIAKIQIQNVKTDNEKRHKMIEWVYAHRYWLFSLAGLIQATIDAINMGIEDSLDFEILEDN